MTGVQALRAASSISGVRGFGDAAIGEPRKSPAFRDRPEHRSGGDAFGPLTDFGSAPPALRAPGCPGALAESRSDPAKVLGRRDVELERARSLVELGGVLRRAGRRRDARQALSQGLDLAARCGARPLIAYAREELRVAGARPRRDWTSGVQALTASELRIVRLAREGRSNRQIAQDLYLSIKTVEGHLARAYSKLDITTRSELDRVFESEKARVPTL